MASPRRNIAERPTFDHELQRVNAEEGHFAIYSKTELDASLKPQQVVVAEYYFTTGNKGVVFSLKTSRQLFAKVQADYINVFETFRLGDAKSSGNVNRKNNLFDWEIGGKKCTNHNSISSRFNLLNPVSMQWNQNKIASSIEIIFYFLVV